MKTRKEMTPREKKQAQEYNREYYAKNKERLYEQWLRRRYNISVAQFDQMMSEQEGACGICGVEFGEHKTVKPHIDHDHACCGGRDSCGVCVRGLLCYLCNVGLGSFADDTTRLVAAITYLDQGTKIG